MGVLVVLVMHDIRKYNLYEGKVRTSLWLNAVQRPKNVCKLVTFYYY